MRRAACRLASRVALGATASTGAVGSARWWTWTSLGEVSRSGRHPSSVTSASAIARDARRLGTALAGFGAFALAGGVDVSPAHARASDHIQPSDAPAVPSGSPQPAFGEGSRPDSVSLAALAAEVSSGPDAPRRRALRLLTRVTLFIDHHDAVLAVPEVLQALLSVLARSERSERRARKSDETPDPLSTFLAARCLADLAKSPQTRAALVADARALRALADGLRLETRDVDGGRLGAPESSDAPDEPANGSGTVAATRAAAEAARLAAELAGDAACHAPMCAAGVVDALARADVEVESRRWWPRRAWRRLTTFPLRRRKRRRARDEGATEARVLAERDRHAAATWFGLAGTSEGSAAIAAADSAGFGVTRRMRRVASAETDRVAFRYAVGCLARLVAGGFFDAAKTNTGAERETSLALASALRSGDGQGACFAAAAARAILVDGSARARASLVKRGFVDGALALLTSPEKGWCAETVRRGDGKRTDGARLCALRLLHAFASSGDEATRRAVAVKGATVLGEFAAGSRRGAGAGAAIREKASATLAALGL